MNILVATDFAGPAQHAADLALALARRLGDQVTLVHVVSPTILAAPEMMVDVATVERAIADNARSSMKAELDRAANSGVTVRAHVEVGLLPEVIARLTQARDQEVRLLIVGSSGRRPVERFFLGSSAERIVLQADVPTLVVRKTGDESLRAWAGDAAGQPAARPMRLVVGLERSRACAHAVSWVRDLRAIVACDVTFVHLYWPPEQLSRLGVQGAGDFLQPDPATVAILERELRAFVGELPGAGTTAFKILPHWGELGSHLAVMGSELDADLLVLGTHQRHGLKRMWLGATTQPTLHAASIPVLCIPAPHEPAAPAAQSKRPRDVLAVTDFSPLANSAIAHAYGLASPGGTVILAHVHDRFLSHPGYPNQDLFGSIAGTPIERDLEKQLRALIPTDAETAGIKTQVQILEGGYPPLAILQAASRLGVDAICLASHGRSGFAKAFTGSVADAVIRDADRPVFIVRGQQQS